MDQITQIYQLFRNSTGVCTDSRAITEGCIFFALKGEYFNGNRFADAALEQGASYAIIDENAYVSSERTILVPDCLSMLQDIARMHRSNLSIPILAITGSNGKTTTKELVSAVLSKKFRVCHTQGNLNNHIGVPLTLLKMNDDTEFGIVEMGANHPGEIAELCTIADPRFGIITNIGKAHLEGFGSFDGVKNTKAELYRHLQNKKGTIFYHKNNEVLSELIGDYPNVISYGGTNANFTGEPVLSPPFAHVRAWFPGGVLYLNTKLTGDYNIENILAAACIGTYFQVDPRDIQTALQNYQPENKRSQLIRKENSVIVMDAYNANPTSMEASLKSFMRTFQKDRYLILGDMLELGAYENSEHTRITQLIQTMEATQVFLVGPAFTRAAAGTHFLAFLNTEELKAYFRINKPNHGNYLIKGSRGIALEKILECF